MAYSKSTKKRIERIIENPHLSMVLNLIFIQKKIFGFAYQLRVLEKGGRVVMEQSLQIKMRKSLLN